MYQIYVLGPNASIVQQTALSLLSSFHELGMKCSISKVIFIDYQFNV